MLLIVLLTMQLFMTINNRMESLIQANNLARLHPHNTISDHGNISNTSYLLRLSKNTSNWVTWHLTGLWDPQEVFDIKPGEGGEHGVQAPQGGRRLVRLLGHPSPSVHSSQITLYHITYHEELLWWDWRLRAVFGFRTRHELWPTSGHVTWNWFWK